MSSIIPRNTSHIEPSSVAGLRFQTEVIDVTGRIPRSHECTAIFIQSRNLQVFSNGMAFRTQEPTPTKTTLEVDDIYLQHVNKKMKEVQLKYYSEVKNGERLFDKNELQALLSQCDNADVCRRLWDYANEQSRETIRIPLEIVNEMDNLVQERDAASGVRKEEIDALISTIAKTKMLQLLTASNSNSGLLAGLLELANQ